MKVKAKDIAIIVKIDDLTGNAHVLFKLTGGLMMQALAGSDEASRLVARITQAWEKRRAADVAVQTAMDGQLWRHAAIEEAAKVGGTEAMNDAEFIEHMKLKRGVK